MTSIGPAALGGEPVAPAAPEPRFAVLGARPVRHAAAPMLAIDLEVSEPSGRQVYMIALSVQVMIEPARRRYDASAHARLVELFGAPERWAVTTRSLVWTALDVLVPPFTGSCTVSIPVSCHYDLELAASKYLAALEDGEAPMAMHFNGTIYYRDERGGLQIVLVPWNTSIDFKLPVAVWRETIEHYYPATTWITVGASTYEALQRAKLDRGLATLDATVQALIEQAHRG
ncbi:MAG: hypothetical protein JO206_00145 [Solirubrobacterales bacterium]|nr:hypothetical protein [Solirubrobacterales bacterium]MBV9471343.1 hypothetical protein [Solirubrobacterales bacterium]